jgi:hypothetical protein
MATGHYQVATAAAAVKPIDSFRSAKNLNKRFCSRPTAKLSAKGLIFVSCVTHRTCQKFDLWDKCHKCDTCDVCLKFEPWDVCHKCNTQSMCHNVSQVTIWHPKVEEEKIKMQKT